MTGTSNVTGRETAHLGMPWEDAYGYAQAVRAGDTVRVSGQLSRDDGGNLVGAADDGGNLVGAAPVDAAGTITGASNMEVRMRTAYANAARVLARFGATLDHVVDEVIYVLDVDAAFAVAGRVRKAAYGRVRPACASTLVGVTRLAFRSSSSRSASRPSCRRPSDGATPAPHVAAVVGGGPVLPCDEGGPTTGGDGAARPQDGLFRASRPRAGPVRLVVAGTPAAAGYPACPPQPPRKESS